MSKVMRFCKPVMRQACTPAVTPPAGPDSTVVTAVARGGRERRHAAVRLHDVFLLRGDAGVAQAAVELRDVARQDRLQIGVDDRRAQPVVFADLRQRSRDDSETLQPGISSRDDLAHALLVLRMQEREQQADGDRLRCSAPRARARSARSAASSSGTQHLAAEVDALRHLAGAALRHQQRRLVVHDVEDRRAVGPRLLGDRIDAAKASVTSRPVAHALAFEQRVGADRGAVTEDSRYRPARRPCASSASTPCRMARDGSSGVEGSLAIETSPVSSLR